MAVALQEMTLHSTLLGCPDRPPAVLPQNRTVLSAERDRATPPELGLSQWCQSRPDVAGGTVPQLCKLGAKGKRS
jgi:hypothetical protein